MNPLTIGILCVGSGIGQSVINSCRLSSLPLRTVGLGNSSLAFGQYDCDSFSHLPTIYETDYVDALLDESRRHRIDLLIPGLDDEALILSQQPERFEAENIKVIVSKEPLVSLCRDKERTSLELNPVATLFVRSYNKGNIFAVLQTGEIGFPVVAKPRAGCASRGVRILLSPEEIIALPDVPEYVIQELALPPRGDPHRKECIEQSLKGINVQKSELSVQLVADSRGELRGKMALLHNLKDGNPVEAFPFDSVDLWRDIDLLYPVLREKGLRGPLNLQGRVTDEGFRFFEMNPRFTGMSGLRALMGFNEVEYCIRDWMGIDDGAHRLTMRGGRIGIRQSTDRVVPIDRNEEVKREFFQPDSAIKSRRVVLLSGATGLVWQAVARRLTEECEFELWVLSENKQRAVDLLCNVPVVCFDVNDLRLGRLALGNIDVLIHAGFPRADNPHEGAAVAMASTAELFRKAAMNGVPAIVNISSQSVYGMANPRPWREDQAPAPVTPEGLARYASELHLENLQTLFPQCRITSLRLSTLIGGGPELSRNDLVAAFSRKALRGLPIRITDGGELIDCLDVRDAASAIVRLLESSPLEWSTLYNIGGVRPYSVLEAAEIAVCRSMKFRTGPASHISVEPGGAGGVPGMDSTRFRQDHRWEPEYMLEDSVDSLLKYYTELNLIVPELSPAVECQLRTEGSPQA